MMQQSGLTEEFLQRHRDNAKKYMEQFNLAPGTPAQDSSQTLQRVKQRLSAGPQPVAQFNEKGVGEFIRMMREKYLSLPKTQDNEPTHNEEDPAKSQDLPLTTEDLITAEREEEDSLSPSQRTAQKPPKAKTEHVGEGDLFNKSLNESSMSMRRTHAEGIINAAISEIVWGIFKPPPEKKLVKFDEFLAERRGKLKYSGLKTTTNVAKLFQEDNVLKQLIERENCILAELDELREERLQLAKLV